MLVIVHNMCEELCIRSIPVRIPSCYTYFSKVSHPNMPALWQSPGELLAWVRALVAGMEGQISAHYRLVPCPCGVHWELTLLQWPTSFSNFMLAVSAISSFELFPFEIFNGSKAHRLVLESRSPVGLWKPFDAHCTPSKDTKCQRKVRHFKLYNLIVDISSSAIWLSTFLYCSLYSIEVTSGLKFETPSLELSVTLIAFAFSRKDSNASKSERQITLVAFAFSRKDFNASKSVILTVYAALVSTYLEWATCAN